jgi:hypothetical protein
MEEVTPMTLLLGILLGALLIFGAALAAACRQQTRATRNDRDR